MNKNGYLRLTTVCIALAGVLGLAFMPPRGADEPSLQQQLLTYQLERVAQFDTTLVALETAAQKHRPVKVLQDRWADARDAFKRVEFMIQHFSPQWHRWFNGANLPVIEPDEEQGRTFQEFEPIGLQVLEEELFDGMPLDDIHVRVQHHTKFMRDRLHRHAVMQRKYPPLPGMYIEAMRHEILRIGSMSIADFDSPVLGRGRDEAAIALDELQVITRLLEANIETEEAITPVILRQLKHAKTAVLADDFSAFYFTRDYLNPLSESLRDLHLNAGVYFRDKAPVLTSLNYHAAGLYDSTLIRPHAFAPLWANQPNDKLASVGRLLFYDPILSLNNQRACGSCHDPAKGFSDGHRQAIGFDKQPTNLRNTPTMLNAALSRAYRYDMAAHFLDEQSPKVFLNHEEFRMSREMLEERVNQSPGYKALFSEAFGQPVNKIDVPLMNTALAEYIRTLVALNSPFDQMIRGEIEPDLTVVAGYDLFMGKATCGTCHFPPTFSGLVPPYFTENESEIIGVPKEDGVNELSPDLGRYNFMDAEAYRHAFKTTSVRNSALTMPYMHNGSFDALIAVVEFYNQGGGRGRGYTVPGQTLDPEPLQLSWEEMNALVVFMEALTDTTGHTSLPDTLPSFPGKADWNKRPIGGLY